MKHLRSIAPLGALALAVLAVGCETKPSQPAKPAETKETAQPAKPAAPAEVLPWTSVAAIESTCEAAKTKINAAREAVKAATAKNEQGVLNPSNEMLAALDTALGTMGLMANVHPDKTTRDAAEKCEKSLKELATQISLDRGLYDVVTGVDVAPLDADAKRFVEKVLRDFRRAGVDKDEATRAKLEKLQKEMVEVGQTFDRNIREDVRKVEADPKELDGLPEDFIKSHKPGENGKVTLTTAYPDYFPVQTYAKNEDLRKRLAIQLLSRASPQNEAVLKRILELRWEYAKTLGYPSYAEYMAEDKMVKSAKNIESFINELAKLARPRMDRDIKEMLARKKKDNPKAKSIEVWDRFYWVDRLRSERYGFDAKSVRPYFEFNNVVKGLFDLYGELFGLRFERANDMPAWHDSVISYRLYSGNERIGRFYLDLHPRDGKYGHAAMFPMVTGVANGAEPVASLVCNFPDPSKSEGGPALMEHGDVRTFFHEFGHLIHHLLARSSRFQNQSGVTVEWDFVEAPSQLLEEWVWDPAVLARFAKHVETGAPIPADLVEKMRRADEFGKGTHTMRQLYFAALSYELHAKDPTGIDVAAFAKDVQKRYGPYPHVPGTAEFASFGHLEGYSSMYYTYQWSLVIAKDIFTRFAKAGLMDAATAGDYRQKILMRGGSRDAAEMVKDFLGRESNLEAYKAWLERD